MSADYNCDSDGTALNFDVVSKAAMNVRAGRCIDRTWKEEIDEDYRRRK